jgi:RND family efflux transporter MFP subunit
LRDVFNFCPGRAFPAALLLGAVIPLVSCSRQPEVVSAGETTAVVPVMKAARLNLTNEIKISAEFEPYQEVDVMAKVAGYVSSIRVDIGDRVAEGALLATLEIPEMKNDLTKAEATIQAAEAEVAAARDEIRRAESARDIAHLSFTRISQVASREKGLIPQQQLDEVQSRDLMAEAQVAAAKSQLSAAQQRSAVARAEEARVKTMFEYSKIIAPFAGVVTKRYANKGSMIQAGTASQSQAMPLVRLAQNNVLRLVLPVPESAVSRIRPGSTLDVMVPSLHKTFPGRVARSAQSVQMSTRTMDTEVDVVNANFILLPGMYAEVNLRLDEHNNALAVPVDSIDGTGAAAHVFVVKDGKLHSTLVATGLETAQRIEIRAGLRDGDTVVVGRQSGLKDGQAVQAKLVDFAGH